MKIRFWGTRGSLPSPIRPEQVEEKISQAIFGMPSLDTNDLDAVQAYVQALPPLLRGTAGGNTSCVEIQAGGNTFIVDAGTGLRELGLELMKGPCGHGQGTVHLFVSHPHWDHIQGFPFFVPAFIPGNRIFIYGVHDMEKAFKDQQRALNFPVPLDYMQAKKEFVSLQVGQPINIGDVRINTTQNGHPGDSYGYRFEDQHSAAVYAGDAEFKQLDDAAVQTHVEFFRKADALIFDAQYTLKEGWQKIDWGHSSAMIGVDIARAAEVEKLILFHHDPTYSDAELREIQAGAINYQGLDTTLPTCDVVVAYEGLTLDLAPAGAVAMQLTPDGEATILAPTGVFDEQGVDQLMGQLARLAEQDPHTHSIIDLSAVETLTTASLKLLLALRSEGPDAEGSFAPIVLAAPSESIRRMIKLAGYLDHFAIYSSVEDALTAVQVRETLDLPGQLIKDRYQIEDRVAEGWLGSVLKATDTHTDRTVALKILSPSFSDETIARFLRQGAQVMALDHPNIVRTFEWEKDERSTYIVEELMTGTMLHDQLRDARILPAEQALDISLEISAVLEYAHSRGMLHGDLKPRNVFLADAGADERPEVKLAGFGLGRLEEGRNLLEAPLLLLDPAYLAPEQILGQVLDARTDLYALGVILYQLFTGRLPFEGSDQELMQAHLRQAPHPPRELSPHISLSLDHLILKLLAKNPNDRHASAQSVRRILGSLIVGAKETIRQPRRLLVGREESVQALRGYWEAARAGRGQLAFISGELGAGKTSLAQHVAAQSQPPVLLVGRCLELEGEPAYDLFAQILRAYFATVPPELLDEQVRQLLGDFARIIPEIHDVLPDLPEPPALEPQQEQLRLMSSLTQFMRRATQERPWLIVLDDLQWADPSSLELLRYLVRHLPSMALFIIGTYHDDELAPGHPLLEALRDLSSQPTYHHVRLERLDQAGVSLVLANLWQQSVPAALTERIYAHTAGNPLYVEEVARGLVDDGFVTLKEGVWHFPRSEEVRLPESVHEVVWRRIGHLSPDTQALLQQAAVLGQVFKFDDLREMSGLPEWEALEHVGVALERQLIQEVPGDSTLRFRHTEIQSVLYNDLGPLRRRILHRQAGEAVERLAQPEPERLAEELAHHFNEAGEFERAVVYSQEAARQAQAAFANEDAILWHNRTLEMLAQLGPEEAMQFESLRLSAHESLGEVLALVGRYDEALEHYASARGLFDTQVLSTEEARHLADLCCQTATVYERRSEYDRAFEWVERGLRYLDKDEPTVEAARLHLIAGWSNERVGRSEKAIDWFQKSATIALQINTPKGQRALAHAYRSLGATHLVGGDFERAVQLCRESVKICQQIGHRLGQSYAYNNLANAYANLGDWGAASDAYAGSLAIAQEIGAIHIQGVITNNLANIYLDRGEWTQAASLYEQSQSIWKQIGAPSGEGLTMSNLAQVHIYQENWSEAETCLLHSQAIFADFGSEEFLPELERRWGELHLKTGKLDEALDHTRRSVELAVEQGTPLEEGMSRRVLGLVRLARGERKPAEAALRTSLQILSDLGSEFEAAKTRLSLAQLAIEKGAPEDAQPYLTQAIETFEKLGAQADLDVARDLERQGKG